MFVHVFSLLHEDPRIYSGDFRSPHIVTVIRQEAPEQNYTVKEENTVPFCVYNG